MRDLVLPKLYAIADAGVLAARDLSLLQFAEGLRGAGVGLVQLRDKTAGPQAVLAQAEVLREVFAGLECLLVMNDRADLAVLANFGGVHVGQGDLPVAGVRKVLRPDVERYGGPTQTANVIVGVSTHTEEQVWQAESAGADYVAIGPVFATGTKLDASPPVGLDGVRRARALTSRPLVAIGGITRQNAASVIAAGADSAAVISGLLVAGETVENVARDFLDLFR